MDPCDFGTTAGLFPEAKSAWISDLLILLPHGLIIITVRSNISYFKIMSNLAQPVDDSAPIVVASVIAEEPISVEDDPVIPTAQAQVLTATTEDPYQLSPDTKTIQKDFESGTPIEPSGSPSQINPDFGVGEESIHSDLEQQKLEAFHSKKDEGAIDKSTRLQGRRVDLGVNSSSPKGHCLWE